MKTLTLGNILTKSEIEQAQRFILEAQADKESASARIAAEIVEPALERINKKTGQANDARYLGYAIEFALLAGMQESARRRAQEENIDAEGFKCEDPTVCE